MPSREQTVANAVELFEGAHYPHGLRVETAWLGIYQVLLWYEHVDWAGYTSLPHIAEADRLRPPLRKRGSGAQKATAWQQRAAAAGTYLAKALECETGHVSNHLDQLMRRPEYQPLQRQNPLGIAFAGLVNHVLGRFGSQVVEFRAEVQADAVFPGISMPGRSVTPAIDLVVLREQRPRAIVSAKWSLRHDRINDITNECPVYKSAALRLRVPLEYFVVTNEFDPARLQKILADSCVDGVAHVHKPLLTTVLGLDGRLGDLLDLADLVNASRAW